MFEYTESMTATVDSPDTAPGVVARDVAVCGPQLVRAAVEHPANQPPETLSRAELIDGIAALEDAKSALDAVQAEWTRAFARTEAAHQIDDGLTEPEKIQRSVAAQIGLACRVSPTEGRKRLQVARDLHAGLDHVRTLFHAGALSADKVRSIVVETAHLDHSERTRVDRLLAAENLDRHGVGKLREIARRLAAQIAPGKFRARCAAARTGRRVTLRLSADGMTDLTAHLPAEQGAACYAALQKAFNEVSVAPAPLTRSRGQVMADTLVERLTGQATAEDVNVEIHVVVPIEALLDPDSPLPAEIPGHGPVPADVLATTTGRTTWRRLVTKQGIVVGGDSRGRKFTGLLAELIRARDRYRCTESFCDAPIREIDHIVRAADGGPTTFDGGRGTCQFHNLLRELPGWTVERVPDGILTTTPTGRRHLYCIPTTAPAGPPGIGGDHQQDGDRDPGPAERAEQHRQPDRHTDHDHPGGHEHEVHAVDPAHVRSRGRPRLPERQPSARRGRHDHGIQDGEHRRIDRVGHDDDDRRERQSAGDGLRRVAGEGGVRGDVDLHDDLGRADDDHRDQRGQQDRRRVGPDVAERAAEQVVDGQRA